VQPARVLGQDLFPRERAHAHERDHRPRPSGDVEDVGAALHHPLCRRRQEEVAHADLEGEGREQEAEGASHRADHVGGLLVAGLEEAHDEADHGGADRPRCAVSDERERHEAEPLPEREPGAGAPLHPLGYTLLEPSALVRVVDRAHRGDRLA